MSRSRDLPGVRSFADEGKTGPLMIQGDHGPVAIRALAIKNFDTEGSRVKVEDLAYKLYPLSPDQKAQWPLVVESAG